MNATFLRHNWHLFAAGAVILAVIILIASAGGPSGGSQAAPAATQAAAQPAAAAPAAPAPQPAAPKVTTYRISAVSSNGIALVLADDPQYKTRTPLHGIGGVSWEDVPASATGVSVQVISQTGDGVSCTITARQTGKVVASQSLPPAHGQGVQSIECDMP